MFINFKIAVTGILLNNAMLWHGLVSWREKDETSVIDSYTLWILFVGIRDLIWIHI